MSGTILLRLSEWAVIREKFTEADKAILNAANCGQVICPAAIILDMSKLPIEIWDKLKGHGHWR